MKICKDCSVELTDNNWYASLQRARTYLCNSCSSARSKTWAKNNPNKSKDVNRKSKLKAKYGISVDEYDKMYDEQNGMCYLCGNSHPRRALNVDHCHTTGVVRKLLCDKCNMALGLINDSTELLEKMKGYLDAYSLIRHRVKS